LTRIYVAPFHAEPLSPEVAPTAAAADAWPYDNGDDPSFHALQKLGGQLSWGVCRQDVRNAIREGDMVVFFSFRKCNEKGETEYRLRCVATVKRKVSQADIWQEKSLSIFRKYCNLLIRPSSSHGIWEHFEPCLRGRRSHKDWLWRTINHTGLKKEQFDKIHGANCFKQGTLIGGFPVEFAHNYVIFSPDPARTLVLSNPPVVARHDRGLFYEKWNEDEFSQGVKRFILEKAANVNGRKRWLRIKNTQHPHRQIVFELSKRDAEDWRAHIFRFVQTSS